MKCMVMTSKDLFFFIKEGVRREVNATKEEALSKGQGREVIFAATFGQIKAAKI